MSGVEEHPILSSPGGWNRYFQAHTDLDPLLETPGISVAFDETVHAANADFRQLAHRGLFLEASRPLKEDPAMVSARLAGAPSPDFAAALRGTRRTRAHQTATGTHAQFEQLIRGARVVGGQLRIHEADDGVFAVTGRPMGDLDARDPGPAPTPDNRQALTACAEQFGLDSLRGARVEQVVFPQTEGATWAYEIGFQVLADAADIVTYLRADDRSILLSFNISSTATAGKGRVFEVNPDQTPDVVEVTLEGLDEPGNLLHGSAFDVTQAGGPRMVRADRDFRVEPSAPEFDEAQVYFHAWHAAEYFRGITGPALMAARPFTPMRVFVNDPASPNNAFYSPSTGDLRFGLFGNRSSARSASVVIHEFGHAITDAICQLGRSFVKNTEARGLSEGFSDYFAASILDDPRLGDYVADDAHGARNCSDQLEFPAGFVGEEHATGAVWASVLWAIRAEMEQAICDQLVIESLNFLDNASTFEDARTALHAVDGRLNGGANQDLIDEHFDARAPA